MRLAKDDAFNSLSTSSVFKVPVTSPNSEFPQKGSVIYDKTTNKILYGNGESFQPLGGTPVGTPLDSGQIWVGSSLDTAQPVTISGDGTLSDTGVLTVTASGSPVGSPLNSGQIWVGDALNTAQPVTISGDGTLSDTGVLTVTPSGGSPYTLVGFANSLQFVVYNGTADWPVTPSAGPATLNFRYQKVPVIGGYWNQLMVEWAMPLGAITTGGSLMCTVPITAFGPEYSPMTDYTNEGVTPRLISIGNPVRPLPGNPSILTRTYPALHYWEPPPFSSLIFSINHVDANPSDLIHFTPNVFTWFTTTNAARAPMNAPRASIKTQVARAPVKVPQVSTKTQVAKAPVKAKVKKASVKKQEIYLLFDPAQVGNSDDAAYDLEYAFHGAYLSRKDALEAFATFMIESGNLKAKDVSKFAKRRNVENLLEQYGWSILDSKLSPTKE